VRYIPSTFVILLGLAISSASCSKTDKTEPAVRTESATAKQSSDPNYRYGLTVRDMNLSWKLQSESIAIKLTAKTKGWLGIGFNPEPGQDMKGANIVIGFIKDGKVEIEDHFGTLKTNHKRDEKVGGKPHIANPAGKEEGGATEISFTIPLNSGDALDSLIDVAKDTTVLLAYGESDAIILKHKFRAILKVNLSTGRYSVLKVR